MSNKLFEKKPFVNGVVATNLSDSQIYDNIANEERAIAALKEIKNKPKSLVAEIKARQANIKELVAYVDERNGLSED